MKKILKWKYYCEFCKKSGGSAYHVKKHEESCTKNPNRSCRFCEISGGCQEDLLVLVAALKSAETPEDGLKKLRDLTKSCPGCMLAAINQSGLQSRGSVDEDGYCDGFYYTEFDFQVEKERFWSEYEKSLY